MGTIYLCAYVTIVAVAGEEPTYGLPGVSRPLAPRSSFFGAYPKNTIIHTSKWFSRAWTLQERLLSHRALYFTHCGVLLRCRNAILSNMFDNRTMLDAREDLDGLKDQIYSPTLQDMCRILTEYVPKNLSFDSDMLNAVVGIFNVLSTRNHSLHHIWGLPYLQDSAGTTVSLNWKQKRPSIRRSGFPSWSPLGWKMETLSFASVDNQFHSGHGDLHVSVWKDKQTIYDLDSPSLTTSTPLSYCLRITAFSARVTQTNLSLDGTGPHGLVGLYLLIRTGGSTGSEGDIKCVKVQWDDESFFTDTRTELHCLFMSSDPSKADCLVLKPCGEHFFERVGIVINARDESTTNHGKHRYRCAAAFSDKVAVAEVQMRTFLIR